ncbi:MAG: hypothetical protein CMH55_07415 [Myxococcales bacterium]|nr:hypothetical protein [Myxococcales bacterium]
MRWLLWFGLFTSSWAQAAQVKIAVPPFQRSGEIASEDASRLASQLRQRIQAKAHLDLVEVSVGDLLARRGPDLALMGKVDRVGIHLQLELRLEDWSRPGSTPTVVRRQAPDLLGLASTLDEMISELFPRSDAGKSAAELVIGLPGSAPSVTEGTSRLPMTLVGSGGAALLVAGGAFAYSRLVNRPELLRLKAEAEDATLTENQRNTADDDFHGLDGQDRGIRSLSLGLSVLGGVFLLWGLAL